MSAIAMLFIVAGMVSIVLGLWMTLNIFSMWPSEYVREGNDITETRVQRKNARFMLVGLVLVAIGFLLMWASGA
jgi:accessory gene regulator protein AgrB